MFYLFIYFGSCAAWGSLNITDHESEQNLFSVAQQQLCVALCCFLSLGVCGEAKEPTRNMFSLVGHKDYFHHGRARALMRLRNEALYDTHS